jgi:hypothetical protein
MEEICKKVTTLNQSMASGMARKQAQNMEMHRYKVKEIYPRIWVGDVMAFHDCAPERRTIILHKTEYEQWMDMDKREKKGRLRKPYGFPEDDELICTECLTFIPSAVTTVIELYGCDTTYDGYEGFEFYQDLYNTLAIEIVVVERKQW